MLVGRQLSRLAWYALLGLFAASLGQVVGMGLPLPNPIPVGDVNLLAASFAACGVVLAARVWGF